MGIGKRKIRFKMRALVGFTWVFLILLLNVNLDWLRFLPFRTRGLVYGVYLKLLLVFDSLLKLISPISLVKVGKLLSISSFVLWFFLILLIYPRKLKKSLM